MTRGFSLWLGAIRNRDDGGSEVVALSGGVFNVPPVISVKTLSRPAEHPKSKVMDD